LRGSIETTTGGGSAFIAQVTLYSAALGVAISQACYAAGETHEWAVLQQLLGELDRVGVLIQAAYFLLPVNANQKTLHRQIQCHGKGYIPFVATDHEI
jgi:hypothetical protein